MRSRKKVTQFFQHKFPPTNHKLSLIIVIITFAPSVVYDYQELERFADFVSILGDFRWFFAVLGRFWGNFWWFRGNFRCLHDLGPNDRGMLCMIRSMPPFPLEHSSVFNKSIVLALRSIALHDAEYSYRSYNFTLDMSTRLLTMA